MQNNNNKLISSAMQSGIYLGLFWAIKYIFVAASSNASMLQFMQPVLAAFTPVLLLQFLIRYRVFVLDNVMSFWHGMQFTIMLFFFASLFESLVAFIHITWVDPQFVGTMYADMVEALRVLNISDSMVSNFESQPIPGAFGYIVNHIILSDVFIGIILSLFVVPISKMIKPRNITTKQSDKE